MTSDWRMEHVGSHFEIGRVEDTVVMYADCSCGWVSDELCCDKGEQQQTAQSVHRNHMEFVSREASS